MLKAFRLIPMRVTKLFPMILAVLAVLRLPLLVAAAETDGKPEKPDISVAYVSPSAAFTPLYVAAEASLFTKYGLNVKPQILGVQVAQKALISEEIDLLVDGPLLVAARVSGAPVKYFGAYMQRYVFQIWAVKGITKLEQLKGKVVAVSAPRGAIEIATRETLKKQGLKPDTDIKFVYNDQVPAILTAVLTGTVAAGTLSAPLNVRAREGGLNFLADTGEHDIPGLQAAFGVTDKFRGANPNTLYAFTKAMAEGVVLARKDSALAKKAIAKYTKSDDAKILDASYEAYAPYWETGLAVREQVIRSELDYLDEKNFPKAKSANPRDCFDNSIVETLEKSGFFASLGFSKQK